jgi:hypothetical protein
MINSECKTLVGKQNYLFLCNDSTEELKVHCENLMKINDLTLSQYTLNNLFIFVYPNKSLILKNFLPDEYVVKYRPAFEVFKEKFKDNLFDLYKVLKKKEDVYYKTDTHININGNYVVYNYFVETINKRFQLNIKPRTLELQMSECVLRTLPYGIGDLTWPSNAGDQVLENITDHFYFHDEITWFYCKYIVTMNNNIKFLNYQLQDSTEIWKDTVVNWHTISQNIIHVTNQNKVPMKIVLFYDSFLLNSLPLYFDLFNEIYLLKSMYNEELINQISPDFIFEFRVERFLS